MEIYQLDPNTNFNKPYVVMVEKKSETEEIRLFSDGTVFKVTKSSGQESKEAVPEEERIAYVNFAMKQFEKMAIDGSFSLSTQFPTDTNTNYQKANSIKLYILKQSL